MGTGLVKKATLSDRDLDLQFISLWVSLSALYAEEMKDPMPYKKSFSKFLEGILNQDSECKISCILWNKIAQPIKSLTENPDSFQHYWDYKNQKIPQLTWKANFEV